VQFTGAVVVEDLGEDTGMSVEVVLVEQWVVVDKGLGESRQPCGGNLWRGGEQTKAYNSLQQIGLIGETAGGD